MTDRARPGARRQRPQPKPMPGRRQHAAGALVPLAGLLPCPGAGAPLPLGRLGIRGAPALASSSTENATRRGRVTATSLPHQGPSMPRKPRHV
jgi:hypothetical protein